jgi:hypothetical protein
MGNFLFGLAKLVVGVAVVYYSLGYLNAHTLALFLLAAAYFAYSSVTVYLSASAESAKFRKMDIRGKFIDPIKHELNVFEWSDLSSVTRARQGTAETEVWKLDEANNRYLVNVSTSVMNYAVYDSAVGTITISNSLGQVLTTLNRLPSSECSACATASTGYPTYANFAEHFRLVHINPAEQPLFAERLDVLRGCAMFRIDTIPTGATSNDLIARSPLAVAVDGTCFFYVPPTQYLFLTGNLIVDSEIALANLPTAFCGSM